MYVVGVAGKERTMEQPEHNVSVGMGGVWAWPGAERWRGWEVCVWAEAGH